MRPSTLVPLASHEVSLGKRGNVDTSGSGFQRFQFLPFGSFRVLGFQDCCVGLGGGGLGFSVLGFG